MNAPIPAVGRLSLSLLLVACSGDSTAAPDPEPDPQPTRVEIQPDSFVLASSADTVQLEAMVRDQDGQPIAGAQVTWSSLQPDVLSVSSAGRAWTEAVGEHRAEVRAAHGSVEATAVADIRISRCEPPAPVADPPGASATVPSYRSTQARAETWPYPETHPWIGEVDIGNDGVGDAVIVTAKMNATENDDTPGGAVFLLVGDGAGGFARDSLPIAPEFISSPGDVVMLDVNGDGFDDAFLPQFGPDAPQTVDPSKYGSPDLLLVQSGGTMVDESSRLDPRNRRPTNIFANAAADIDCDGDTDLYSGGQPGRLYINDGTGLLTAEDGRTPSDVSSLENNGGTNFQGAEFCDVNRDGAPDLLLTADGMTEPERLLLNDGFGRFSPAAGGSFPTLPSQNVSREYLACGDFDRDGWNDFVFGEAVPEIVMRFVRNQGDGTFTEETGQWLPAATPPNPGDFEAVDINGDGWLDVLTRCDVLVNTGTHFVRHNLEDYLQSPYRCFDDGGFPTYSLAIPLRQTDGTVDILLNTSPPVVLQN